MNPQEIRAVALEAAARVTAGNASRTYGFDGVAVLELARKFEKFIRGE